MFDKDYKGSKKKNKKKNTKENFLIIDDAIIFLFNMSQLGYFLDGYDPNMTEHKFRMRNLIFMFNRLDEFTNGFQDMRKLMKIQYTRKKVIVFFTIFLILVLPLLFSLQIVFRGRLETISSELTIIGLVAGIILGVMFYIIIRNTGIMEKRTTRLKLAKEIKRYLLQENYYWLYKHFVIFDVDRKLNIYLVFMARADVARKYEVARERIRRILRENNLLQDY
jgi:hypothetical protein